MTCCLAPADTPSQQVPRPGGDRGIGILETSLVGSSPGPAVGPRGIGSGDRARGGAAEPIGDDRATKKGWRPTQVSDPSALHVIDVAPSAMQGPGRRMRNGPTAVTHPRHPTLQGDVCSRSSSRMHQEKLQVNEAQ
jgi:hypothetical protein